MVSYYPTFTTMYHGQQTSWYPSSYRHQPQQQFLSCMHEMGEQQWMGGHPHSHPTHNHTHAHSHAVFTPPQEWPVQDEHLLPSPPITELSSPGPGVTPPAQPSAQSFIRPPSARSPYDWIKKPSSPPVRPSPARSPFEWIKKPSYSSQPTPGKTRTKDKYRVVYTDHQRLELEKEFHYSRYITIRRKAELAATLGLSERQVKIWFQNRRAKERKQMKKREELIHKEKMQHLAML